jgi:hypothetical protein
MSFLVLPGRLGKELVRGRYTKVALDFRIGGGFITANGLERQRFVEEWLGVHQLDDASAMPTALTRTCRRLQMRRRNQKQCLLDAAMHPPPAGIERQTCCGLNVLP